MRKLRRLTHHGMVTDELPPQIQAIADRIADVWGEIIDVGYVVEQCKTKFGALRYYARPEDTDDVDTQMTFNEIIWAAEGESGSICEDCGNPGHQVTLRGWIWTLCPEHTQQRREETAGTRVSTPVEFATETNPSDDVDGIGVDGLPPGRDCPSCGQPLEPGHIDSSIALVWLCPTHGLIDRTTNPLSDPQ